MPSSDRPQTIVLASSSPYRAELLARLGLPFEQLSPQVDETAREHEAGRELALRLAGDKAAAVAAQRADAVVIGSDQVAECRGRLLGKPGARQAAIEQLSFCSGAEIVFHTAVVVQRGDDQYADLVPTTVQMRSLDRDRIARYVDADRPFDCAGAMKSEALGISLAERIASDDPTALIGLPLTRVVSLLSRFGIDLP